MLRRCCSAATWHADAYVWSSTSFRCWRRLLMRFKAPHSYKHQAGARTCCCSLMSQHVCPVAHQAEIAASKMQPAKLEVQPAKVMRYGSQKNGYLLSQAQRATVHLCDGPNDALQRYTSCTSNVSNKDVPHSPPAVSQDQQCRLCLCRSRLMPGPQAPASSHPQLSSLTFLLGPQLLQTPNCVHHTHPVLIPT